MQADTHLRRRFRLPRLLIWSTLGILYFSAALIFGREPLTHLHDFILVSVFGFVLSGFVESTTFRTWRLPALKRYAVLGAVIVVCSLVQAFLEVAIERMITDAAAFMKHWEETPAKTLNKLLFAISQYFILIIWVHAFYAAYISTVLSSEELLEKERRLAAVESQAQKATLSALRAQVNPHFLFNALNAIASLIGARRNEEAEEALLRLSEFFRASLSAERRQMVTVSDELEMLEAYLDMEQIRFPDRLNVLVTSDEASANALLPSFLLQPLVENAIKYAVGPATAPVRVEISARREGDALVLTVLDDGRSKPDPAQAGEGVGLENVRNRITTLYGQASDMQVTAGEPGFRVTLRIPFSTTALPEATE